MGSLRIISKYEALPSCWPKMLMRFLLPFFGTFLLLITSYLKFFYKDRVLAVTYLPPASYPDSMWDLAKSLLGFVFAYDYLGDVFRGAIVLWLESTV